MHMKITKLQKVQTSKSKALPVRLPWQQSPELSKFSPIFLKVFFFFLNNHRVLNKKMLKNVGKYIVVKKKNNE